MRTLLLLLLFTIPAQASTVWYAATNWWGTQVTNAVFRVTPVSTPTAAGQFTVTGPARRLPTTTGFATNTPVPGNYRFEIEGDTNSMKNPVFFAVPDDSDTYNYWDLKISGGNTYIYSPGVQKIIGSNGVTVTPGNGKGTVTITASGGGSNPNALTNHESRAGGAVFDTNLFAIMGAFGGFTLWTNAESVSGGIGPWLALDIGKLGPGAITNFGNRSGFGVYSNGVYSGGFSVVFNHGGSIHHVETGVESPDWVHVKPDINGPEAGGDEGELLLGSQQSYQEVINIQRDIWGNGGSLTFLTTNYIIGGPRDPTITALTNTLTGFAELWFENPGRKKSGGTIMTPGTLQQRLETNGVVQRGKLVQQRYTDTASGSSYAIDFTKAVNLDVTVSSSAVTLSTTGEFGGTTNYERRVVYLRTAGVGSTISYPNWNNDGVGYPSNLVAGQMIVLELEKVGAGETNVQVRAAQLLSDNTFVWDTDALAFFTRASITDGGQKGAVNTLVLALKAANIWTKFDAVYPFVGGNATAHSKNLVANTFNITWSGGLTHNANGVTGDGTNYGDTGFVPNAGGHQYALNSAAIGVACRTASPTDGTVFMGGWNTMAASLSRNNFNVRFSGLNANSGGSEDYSVSSNFVGFFVGSRTGVSTQAAYVNGVSNGGDTITSSSLDSVSFYILARNEGTPAHQSNANLDFAFICSGLSQQNVTDLYNAVATYNTMLGR